MSRKKTPRAATARRIGYELIVRDNVAGHPIYALLDEIVFAHHEHLKPARIALAWCLTWQPDVDGRVKLGQCKKSSDLDRELVAFDFVILLRRAFWRDERVSDAQRRALLDHELCHAARQNDKHGDPAVDERGRAVWRIRRHDIEEFSEIVERHGIYSRDLENLAGALRRQGVGPFVPCERCSSSPGWITLTAEGVAPRVDRCPCWLTWAERRDDHRADQKASA